MPDEARTKPPAPSRECAIALLCLAAVYTPCVWTETIPDEAWEWAKAEGYIGWTRDSDGDKMAFLTDKGQDRLREAILS